MASLTRGIRPGQNIKLRNSWWFARIGKSTVDHRSTNPQVAAFLEEEGNEWLKRNRDSTAPLQYWEQVLFGLAVQGSKHKPEVFLEVGSSSGDRLVRINSVLRMDCVGVDPSSDAVSAGLAEYGDAADFRIGTANSIPAADKQIAVLFFGFCLYLVPEEIFADVLDKVRRVLKPSGFVAILDFDFGERVKVPYKHKEGLYSYRRPYAEVFGSAGYSLIAKLPIQKHGPVEERIAVPENPMDRISAWLFKAPSQEPVADIG